MGDNPIDWAAITAIATAVTALSVPVSAAFIWLQLRQAKEATESQVEVSQSQVYQNLLDRAERIHLNQALDAVRSLNCDSYDDYSRLPEEIKDLVKVAVEFFNEIRHLLPPDSNMLDLRHVRSLWGLSILSCADKLWTSQAWLEDTPISWWLEGFRSEKADAFRNPQMSSLFYRGFERLC
jgi:hypothetical protein